MNICGSKWAIHRFLFNWILSLIFKFAFYFGMEEVTIYYLGHKIVFYSDLHVANYMQ